MILGLLPAIRGGLGELARTGQDARLIDGYLQPYARAFEEVRYFSYLDESLRDFTSDPELLARVRLYLGGGWHAWAYGSVMTWRHAHALRACSVLRVFQMTGGNLRELLVAIATHEAFRTADAAPPEGGTP